MKKNYKLSILFILFSFCLVNFSFAEENYFHEDEIVACSNFYDAVKKSKNPRVKNLWPRYYFDDFGFYLKLYDNNGEWVAYRDENENIKIGEVYSYEALNQLKPEDSIVNINGERLKSVDQFNSIAYSDDTEIITLDLINQNGKLYKAKIEVHSSGYSLIDYSLEDIYISDINIKKGTVTFTLREAFQYNYDKQDNDTEGPHPIHKIAKQYLVDEDEENPYIHICKPTEEEFKYSGLMNPLDNETRNLVSSDRDLIDTSYKITTYVAPFNEYDNVRVENQRTSVQTVRNQFNLRSFPFDKQTIRYEFADLTFELRDRLFWPQSFTKETLDRFMNLDDISGWHKNKYEIKRILHRDTVDMDGQYRDAVSIEIELERKHGYYIFKVILPIILILSVCWSVVWVDPKELESRLTITIVCLLSLIAYNFVIDAELPKLEYLTVLDWIVLISYFYATVPNFLSIISFRLQKTNIKLSNKLEIYSKRYGLSSYVLSIFIIVWINAFSNPNNSSSLISWMVPHN
tara:strand:+ start:4854 stop:6404 length:1551 start_codon:yes stop_codon:yes gene_type:complete